jgi:hypothetical protein
MTVSSWPYPPPFIAAPALPAHCFGFLGASLCVSVSRACALCSAVAVPADANVVIHVFGTNLGLVNSVASPPPIVSIGNRTCFQPFVINSTVLQCTALASAVGAYPVTGTCAGGRDADGDGLCTVACTVCS